MKSLFKKNNLISIDLGTSNTLIATKDALLLNEPTILAINKQTHSTIAVGSQAYAMYEKEPINLKTIKPLKHGVVADYTSTQLLLSAFFKKLTLNKTFLSTKNILICVPYSTTEVEKRAVRDAAIALGANTVQLIYEPLAACIGEGIDITQPSGSLIIDIGGGTTEISIVSLSEIVCNYSLRIGGELFDRDIIEYIRHNYNVIVSQKSAEMLKIMNGTVSTTTNYDLAPFRIVGRDIATGLPKALYIKWQEVAQMLDKSFSQIEIGIIRALEKCPPEIAADIYKQGIFLTGGGAKLRGIVERLEKYTKLSVNLVEAPLLSVSKGLAECMQEMEKYERIFV